MTSLKPIKEKKQAPARGHKTQRNLAQTRPKQQPPGDRLKTAKHHLNPDANPAKKPSPAACRSDKSETHKGEETGPSTWTQNATQPSPDTPKTATSRRSTQNSQTPPKSGRKPSKKPSPAACRSDKSETHKGEETGPSTWTQNATQPSPDTPKTATSRRSTQNSQTPPKSGRKPSKKPSPAAWRSDKSETPKGEETGPSTWTQNATQPRTRNSQTPLLLHEHTNANLRVAYALLFASPSKKARGRRIYMYLFTYTRTWQKLLFWMVTAIAAAQTHGCTVFRPIHSQRHWRLCVEGWRLHCPT